MSLRRPIDDPKSWWRQALAGERPDIDINEPQPGFYQRRLVKGGPFVPCHIWMEQPTDPETGELCGDVKVCCSVNGREADADDHWMYCCDQPITEKQFDYLTKLSAYARAHDPREPLAKPRKPINPLTFPLPTFGKKRK